MTGRSLGVALVSREYPPFYGGGIGTYARWAVPALRDAGVRVHVVTETHDRSAARVTVDGSVTVHRVPMCMGRGGWTGAAARFSLNAGRCVAGLAGAGEIDVVEFAECEAAGVATTLLRGAGGIRVPTVVHLHTPSEQLLALRSLPGKRLDASMGTYIVAERLALHGADRVVAPSMFIATWAAERYGLGVCPTVIPYAIGPLPDVVEPPEAPVVLYAGRIEPRKGVEVLIRAWSTVLEGCPNATLLLAGADTGGAPDGGSMRAYLESLLPGSARARVRFLGRLRPGALVSAYRSAALCVVPSLWENFPNTCIEAMTHGRSVVVSDSGGMAEMIGDSSAGRVFASGDPAALASALRSALRAGPASWRSSGRAARARIATMCDPARVAEARIELYEETVRRCQDGRDGGGVAGRRDAWCDLERLASGTVPSGLVPSLAPGVSRWAAEGVPG